MHVNMLEFMCVSHCSSCTPYLSQALTSANHVKLGWMAVACWWWGACRAQWMGVYPRLLVLGNGHYLAHWAPSWAALLACHLLVLEQSKKILGYCSGCDNSGGPHDDTWLDGSPCDICRSLGCEAQEAFQQACLYDLLLYVSWLFITILMCCHELQHTCSALLSSANCVCPVQQVPACHMAYCACVVQCMRSGQWKKTR